MEIEDNRTRFYPRRQFMEVSTAESREIDNDSQMYKELMTIVNDLRLDLKVIYIEFPTIHPTFPYRNSL